LQNTLPIPYRYPTHTLSTQETYHTDTLPITETETVTVTETEQNIKNIKNKRFKNSVILSIEREFGRKPERVWVIPLEAVSEGW